MLLEAPPNKTYIYLIDLKQKVEYAINIILTIFSYKIKIISEYSIVIVCSMNQNFEDTGP